MKSEGARERLLLADLNAHRVDPLTQFLGT
jgi:hypothetical protein